MSKMLLIALAALPASAIAATDNADNRERRLCKREVATGSLVQAKRTCLTKKEWGQTREQNRRVVDEWQNAVDGSRKSG